MQHKKRPRSSEPDEGQMSQCHIHEVAGSKPAMDIPCSPPAGLRVVTQGLSQPALSAEQAASLGRSMSYRSDSTLRTYDSGLRQPRQARPFSARPFSAREVVEPNGLLSPSDYVSLSHSVRSSSMPAHAQDSHKLTPISKLRTVSHATLSSDPRLCEQDPKQMLASFLSHESTVSTSPLLPGFEPLSPTSSAMMATLLIPESPMAGNDASALLPDSPVAGNLASSLSPFFQCQHSPDSGQSHRSSDTRTASQSPALIDPQDHWTQLESSLAQPYQSAGNDYRLRHVHTALHHDSVGMAGRLEPHTLSPGLMTQDSGLTTPPRTQSKRPTDPRLRVSRSARSLNSPQQLSNKECLSWPSQGPYNIERWQASLMQYVPFLLDLHQTVLLNSYRACQEGCFSYEETMMVFYF